MESHKVSNHPVHLVDNNGNLFPTALIPFCSYSNSMSVMGEKISQFDAPVCNSFKPKIIKDQLCYEVDPNMYRDKVLSDKLSITLFINHNEDRHFPEQENNIGKDEEDLLDVNDSEYFINVGTISM